ncbi:uncharacterized protein LOC17894169 isoform X2 [Capsella rubella]|uniref:uncharacterized protein LOC17894169 isoform X2 n=1 Tax=Capsella rubella TaxID=81985 RepID=UPI000CD50DD9|nr:uncharacterized protein LOC17894169 isoform X2 [Capsella rubella]
MAMKELRHGSHECVLTSPETIADGICNMCFKDKPVEFACSSCNFDLCKACSDIPPKVSHEFHSEHPLDLCLRKYDQKPGHIICSGCGNMSSDCFYKCKECEIYLDLDCALLPNIFRSWDIKTELHYSHAHLLKRCRPGPDARGSCLLCELPLSPSSICYGCVHCYGFVHERCRNFPVEFQHPVHPQHPLKRLDFTLNCGPGISCYKCRNEIYTVPVGCLECKFFLHLRCADSMLRGLMHKSHQHMLFYVGCYTYVYTLGFNENYHCAICNKYTGEQFYQCLECGWKVHCECIEIPRSLVKKNFHIHPLAFTIFLGEDELLEYCGVCETMVHVGHHVYSCQECDYLGHIECILRKEAPSPLYLKDLDMTRGTNGEDCKTEKLENKLTVNVIEHTHVMMSWDTGNNNTSCGICEGNILSSSWKCETCYFFAHDSCVKLGRPSRHRLHLNHDLTLMSSYPTGVIMSCNTCKGEIRGFNLLCRICILITCMRCVVKFGELQRGQKVIGTTKVKCSMYVGSHHLFQGETHSSHSF